MGKTSVTVKGQIVNPSDFRRKFGIKEGMQVYVTKRNVGNLDQADHR